MSAGQTSSFASVNNHDNNADNYGQLKKCRVESADAHTGILLKTVNRNYKQVAYLQVPITQEPEKKILGLLLSSVDKSMAYF